MTLSQFQKWYCDFQAHVRKEVQLSHHQSLIQFDEHQALGPGWYGPGQTGEATVCPWPMKLSGPGGWAVYLETWSVWNPTGTGLSSGPPVSGFVHLGLAISLISNNFFFNLKNCVFQFNKRSMLLYLFRIHSTLSWLIGAGSEFSISGYLNKTYGIKTAVFNLVLTMLHIIKYL